MTLIHRQDDAAPDLAPADSRGETMPPEAVLRRVTSALADLHATQIDIDAWLVQYPARYVARWHTIYARRQAAIAALQELAALLAAP